MRVKILRGYILQFLYTIYPAQTEEIIIIETFYRDWKVGEIKKSLQYLTDKGYIEKKEHPNPLNRFEKLTTFKISPKGVDLVEKQISDASVILPEEL